uniref:Uncharacterized protein n=1 Tax=Timema poppense TaxID=170557 RepID=A0A7R9DKZ0_TIMPO|nr:unnamed protein product [Timema poppensis]
MMSCPLQSVGGAGSSLMSCPLQSVGGAGSSLMNCPLHPTKGGGKLEMLGNVKSQMTSWLGSGVLGGLRKNEGDPLADSQDPAATGEGKPEVESPAVEKSVKSSGAEHAKEDDDNSSATGGADSDVAASEPGTPGEDKEGAQPFGAGVLKKQPEEATSCNPVAPKH